VVVASHLQKFQYENDAPKLKVWLFRQNSVLLNTAKNTREQGTTRDPFTIKS